MVSTPVSQFTLRLQSDSRLVELARAGYVPAVETIVERYRPPLLRYCTRLLAPDGAEDIVQQTFTNALVALNRDDRPRELRPWLYRIAHNLSINALLKNGSDYDQLPEDFDGVPQPPDIVGQRWQLKALVQQIADLPERQRSALVLREFEGRSYEEIAGKLRATPAVVRQLLHRARTRLRDGVGMLVPFPVVRAMLGAAPQASAGSDRVAEIAAGAGAGGGLAKVGLSVLAAATLAAGTTQVAVHHKGGTHRGPENQARATQLQSSAGAPSAAAGLASGRSGDGPAHQLGQQAHSGSGGGAATPTRHGVEGKGGATGEDRTGARGERGHSRSGDRESGDHRGSPSGQEEGSADGRGAGGGADQPGTSEDHSASGSSGRSGDAGHDGSGSSAPSGGDGSGPPPSDSPALPPPEPPGDLTP